MFCHKRKASLLKATVGYGYGKVIPTNGQKKNVDLSN